ncbi:MAG: hypothetical protein KDJ65_04980, partial [Anaerolineae bacterium]|nr:hypothetical protein [Anaerolineae bacterium]
LLELGNQISHTHFQASTGAQAAFQSQLTSWFGLLANGGSPMTIFGLTKIWFISIVAAVVVGTGFLAVIVVSIFIFSGDDIVAVPVVTASATADSTPSPNASTTAVPGETETPATTVSPAASASVEPSTTPAASPSAEPSTTPNASPTAEPPTIIFIGGLGGMSLCQGNYGTQTTLVNYGNLPVNDAALVWEVVEGGDFIDNVNIVLPELAQANSDNVVIEPNPVAVVDDVVDAPAILTDYVPFDAPISIKQDVKLDVKVKVKDNWWNQKSGTKIKVKLSVKNKIKFDQGKQDTKIDYKYDFKSKGGSKDGYSLDYKVKVKSDYYDPYPSQIFTIVKQDAQWVSLNGVAQPYGDQKWLIDGVVVVTNPCTYLPVNFVPGANVQVIGFIQPNGTFVAINFILINTNVTIINFDSGVPMPGADDDDDGGSSKGGGSKKGGSKKGGSGGSGGSKKGGS